MIYTNNINTFEKNLRKQLELTLNLSNLNYEVRHSDNVLYVKFYETVLTYKELSIIEALLTDSYIIAACATNTIEIWTTWSVNEKEGQ